MRADESDRGTGAASKSTGRLVSMGRREVGNPIKVDGEPMDPWTIRAHGRTLLR